MKVRILCLVMFSFFMVIDASATDPEWLGKMKTVKLLSDSYEDVLKIFGNPVDDTTERELSEYFDFKDGRLWVLFESGNCVSAHWKVPAYTVSELGFSPEEWINPRVLGIKSFEGFSSNPIHEGREGYEYVSDQLGLTYIVNRGKIQNVIFRPSNKHDHLLCPPEKSLP